MNDFPALGVAAALDPEIGVDEQQRFDGKIFQLQIPDGMVGRNMSDAGQADAAAAGVGIVIVQVGHALFFVFLAAVFPQVMAQSRAGNEGQVDGLAEEGQLTRRMQGDVMDAGNMAQRVEGGNFRADAHEFIDILIFQHLDHVQVFPRIALLHNFFIVEKIEIDGRVKGQHGPFVLIQSVQQLHEHEAPQAEFAVAAVRYGLAVPAFPLSRRNRKEPL